MPRRRRRLIEAHRAIVACAGEIADAHRHAAARAQSRRRLRHALLRRRGAARHLPHGDGAPRAPCATRRRTARDDALSLELGRWLVGRGRRLSDPRPRPHRKLRRDLPHHRRRRPPSARRDRLPAASAGAAIIPIAVANRFDAPRDEQVTVTGCLAHAASTCSATRSCCPRAEPAT